MKWLNLVILVVAVEGCTSQTAATAGSSTAGGGSSSGATSAGATSTGTSSGGGTSSASSTTGGTTSGSAVVCNPACGANASCDAGVCHCAGGASNCPLEDGGLHCVDEQTDNSNCSACSNACPPESTCRGGVCDCDAGPACLTNDNGLECFAFGSDPENCGSCGNVCSAGGSVCMDGGCACSPGSMVCGLPDAGTPPYCINVESNVLDCGSCGNECATSLGPSSSCRRGVCTCGGIDSLCALVPATSPPSCDCQATRCSAPSFATDIYPLLAQQAGAFGCAASGCHSGAAPAGGLAFLDEAGDMDAGMAYAELVGLDGGGSSAGVPACDGGLPAGAPSTQCACVSRVVPSDANDSYLIDVILNQLPAGCAADLPMPINADGGWVPLSPCAQQLIEQWVEFGAEQ